MASKSSGEIEAIVAEQLGPGRVLGDAQPGAFRRQKAMYLASPVAKWSTTEIGTLYNGRDPFDGCVARVPESEPFVRVDQDVDDIVTLLAEEIGVLAESICSGERLRPAQTYHCSMTPFLTWQPSELPPELYLGSLAWLRRRLQPRNPTRVRSRCESNLRVEQVAAPELQPRVSMTTALLAHESWLSFGVPEFQTGRPGFDSRLPLQRPPTTRASRVGRE